MYPLQTKWKKTPKLPPVLINVPSLLVIMTWRWRISFAEIFTFTENLLISRCGSFEFGSSSGGFSGNGRIWKKDPWERIEPSLSQVEIKPHDEFQPPRPILFNHIMCYHLPLLPHSIETGAFYKAFFTWPIGFLHKKSTPRATFWDSNKAPSLYEVECSTNTDTILVVDFL